VSQRGALFCARHGGVDAITDADTPSDDADTPPDDNPSGADTTGETNSANR
jgi:hypothetical protein